MCVWVEGGGGENRDETECVVGGLGEGGKSSETETEQVVSKTKSSCWTHPDLESTPLPAQTSFHHRFLSLATLLGEGELTTR